jgi:hypothetical protein
MSKCAFCGHPDARHRTIDAIEERIAAGEPQDEVLHDYGMTPAKFVFISRQLAELELAAGWDGE